MSDLNANKTGYKETKVGWIPNDWNCCRLPEVAKVSRGRFSPRPRNDPRFYGGPYPFVQTGDVSKADTYIQSHTQTLNDEGIKVSKLFEAGTILMTIAANIGDCAILSYPCACPDSLVGIEPVKAKVNEYYLSAYLNSVRLYQRYLAPKSSQHNVNVEIIETYSVPVPPLKEQKKIAEILSCCDDAIQKNGHLIKAKQRQKKVLMQHLLTGKKRLPGFTGNWKAFKIGKLLKEVSRPVEWDDDASYNLISVKRRSGGLFFRESLDGHEILTKVMHTTHTGDFLISKMQVVHGAMAMTTPEFDGGHVSGSYITLVVKDRSILHMPFFDYLSRTKWLYHLAFISSYGVVIEKMTFNLRDFLKKDIQVPPTLEEQVRICEVLNTCEQEEAVLTRKLAALVEQKKALMQKLLTGQVRVKI